jgi:hypothetical protein
MMGILYDLIYDHVHLAYNPSFSAWFFSGNIIFLSQQISQQCFSAGLLAQPNGAYVRLSGGKLKVLHRKIMQNGCPCY